MNTNTNMTMAKANINNNNNNINNINNDNQISDEIPLFQIRAHFTEKFIRVYQAYNRKIALPAARQKDFSIGPDFRLNRTTWIKPSFCWMAYRAGYGFKDENQERILAIDLDREWFDARILGEAVLVHRQKKRGGSQDDDRIKDVIVQWDPERDVTLSPKPYRSIQIGIRGATVKAYANAGSGAIVNIQDMTEVFHEIHGLIESGKVEEAMELLPIETEYPFLPDSLVEAPPQRIVSNDSTRVEETKQSTSI